MTRKPGTRRKLFDCDPALAERIKNFRFTHKIATESGAIRSLIVAGLAAQRRKYANEMNRQADLRLRLKTHGPGPCTDLVLLQAIAETKNYLIGGVFVPIEPEAAEEAIISGKPLDLIWPQDGDLRNHKGLADLYLDLARETGRSVAELYRLVLLKREQKGNSRP